jgi:hypothetical protein
MERRARGCRGCSGGWGRGRGHGEIATRNRRASGVTALRLRNSTRRRRRRGRRCDPQHHVVLRNHRFDVRFIVGLQHLGGFVSSYLRAT